MKLYNSIGPNPKVVRVFMAEKGIELPKVDIDLMGGENRKEPFLAKNPSGQSPALELDNGNYLAEITAICEYLDEKYPGGSLIGTNAEERAETRMWVRRIDLNIVEPLANGFRYSEGLQLFKSRMRCLPEAAAGLKQIAQDKLAWLDGQIAGRQWIAGNRFSLADILLFVFLEFGASVGQPINPELKNISAWYERVKARPSSAA
jgi:glutathione S-transferase